MCQLEALIELSETRNVPITFRNWDRIIGDSLLNIWGTVASRELVADKHSVPIFLNGHSLLPWLCNEYKTRLDEPGHRILPSETVNLEGSRAFRRLYDEGWTGPGYIIETHEPMPAHLALGSNRWKNNQGSIVVSIEVNRRLNQVESIHYCWLGTKNCAQ